jgi:hypothetical protein
VGPSFRMGPAGTRVAAGETAGAAGSVANPRVWVIVADALDPLPSLDEFSGKILAAAVAAGVFLIAKGGEGTCDAKGTAQCPNTYPSKGVGFAIAGAGLVAAGAGLWGLLSTPSEPPVSHARLDLGPGWLNLRGTF